MKEKTSLARKQERQSDLGMVKRFDIELFIIHPTLDPKRISAELGLEAKVAQRVGDQRRTPAGRPLAGTYEDTRWRHSRRFETSGQHFVDGVLGLIADVETRKAF